MGEMATQLLDHIDPRISLGFNGLLILFLSASWARCNILREPPRAWMVSLLIATLVVTFSSEAFHNSPLFRNSQFIARLAVGCAIAQFVLSIALVVSCMMGGAKLFALIYIGLFCGTMQGQIILLLTLFFIGVLAEFLIRVSCGKLTKFYGTVDTARFVKKPLRAAAIRGADIMGNSCGCVLCMEPFYVDDLIAGMRCGTTHTFHFNCLAKHLSEEERCPICGQELNIR